MKKLITLLVVGFVLASAGASWANPTVLFSDNFDADTVGPNGHQLTKCDFNNWRVKEGTLDLIGQGSAWFDYNLGHGLYVDLDGNGNQGTLVSAETFTLMPGQTYTLQFDLAGNQGWWEPDLASSQSDTVAYGIGGTTLGTVSAPRTQGFATYTLPFSVTAPTVGSLSFFNTTGIDAQGALLDNVILMAAPTVPAPGAVLLGSIGVGLVGWFRRRRAL